MLLLFSLLFNSPPLQTDPNSFRSFKKDGTEQYCLVDYRNKQIHCLYKTIEECRNQYETTPAAICFDRKHLKLGDEQ